MGKRHWSDDEMAALQANRPDISPEEFERARDEQGQRLRDLEARRTGADEADG